MKDLKVGVIGCGGHGGVHLRMIAGEPRLHLAAIAEIDQERRERAVAEHGPEQAFEDYQDMLGAADLDLVYVATMPGHHCPIVLTCLEEGVNVSVEKPPGMTSNETEMMAEAARGSKGKAMVSFDRRYIPEVLAVRRLLQERGGAVHVGATCNKPSPAWARRLADVTPDPVISDAIHYADLLRWLAGPAEGKAALPIEVYSEVEDGERACDHRHNAAIRFDSGAIGSLISHYGVGSDIQRAEAYADDFSAYLDMFREPRVEWIGAGCTRVEMYAASYDEHGDARGQLMEGPLDLEAVGGPGFNETRHFVDCILNDRTPWSNLDDAVHTMRLCEAIRRGHKGAL